VKDLIQKVIDAPIVQETIIPGTLGVTGAGASWMAISAKVSSVVFVVTGIAGAVLLILTATNMYYKFRLTKLNYEKALREANPDKPL